MTTEPTTDENASSETPARVIPSQFAKFKVRTVQEMQDSGVAMFLYSKGGGGKTTLAAGAADEHGPVVYIDAEGGTKAISDREDIEVIPVTRWQEINDFRRAVEQTPPSELPWRTIVFDNMTEYSALLLQHIAGNEQPTWPQYGQLKRDLLGFVRFFRNLGSRPDGPNIIFICWDSLERDEESKKLMYRVNFTPAVQGEIPGIVDIIGYIEPIDGDPDHRKLSFEFSSKTDAKFRRNMGVAARSVPNSIVYGLDNLPMGDILNALKKGVPFPASKYGAAARPRR